MATIFDVVFQGQLVSGADPAQVRANLAKFFKADTARIEALFSGQPTVIKKAVDEATGHNYQAALAKVGAVVTLVAVAGEVVPAVPTNLSSPPTPAAPAPVAFAVPSAPPMTIAEPGVLLVEPTVFAAANFDTTALTLAEVGVTLVEPAVVVPPQFDLSELKLDPPRALSWSNQYRCHLRK